MGQTALQDAMQAVERLNSAELREVEQLVRRLRMPADNGRARDALYAALLDRGTIRRVPSGASAHEVDRSPVQITGEPLSQTVIRDRR